MDAAKKISDLLHGESRQSDALKEYKGLADAQTVFEIIYKYSPTNDGSKIDRVGYDQVSAMIEDMRDLSALQLWVGTLLGRLRGLEKVVKRKAKLAGKERYRELRMAENRSTQEVAKLEEELEVTRALGGLDELEDAIGLVEFAFKAAQEHINVLKKCVEDQRTSNAQFNQNAE